MTTSSLASRFRQVLTEHEHGALGGIDLAEALAQAATVALTAPQEGELRERLAEVIWDAWDERDSDWSEVSALEKSRWRSVANVILAAYPVLGRDIAGEIEALNAEIVRLQKQNSDMSWALYPDRMGK